MRRQGPAFCVVPLGEREATRDAGLPCGAGGMLYETQNGRCVLAGGDVGGVFPFIGMLGSVKIRRRMDPRKDLRRGSRKSMDHSVAAVVAMYVHIDTENIRASVAKLPYETPLGVPSGKGHW